MLQMTELRLSAEETEAIRECGAICFGDVFHEIYLFGSRTHLDLKGGDIDLLVVSEDRDVDQLHQRRVDFLLALKDRIGDQKIDLVVAGKSALEGDPFLKSIWRQARLLHRN